ncbi:Ribokinase [Neolewinella maritima]|uniref:Ribokinase n=1 Tax=Neolewinella maritima TaxID=1383882 RepID=A0ABM9AZF6_9BACT|nr:ribokinase [Neolewinella maritima]CAH1000178.1 Ribokinase [Neolewinella maritima]
MPRITVVGSSNTDMVVRTPRFPQAGETLLGGEFFLFAGGKGANQAVAAARLGGHVRFVARVGDDLFGRQALEGFKREGIDCSAVSTDPQLASGTALITVNEAGENTIVVASGANDALRSALLAPISLEANEYVLTQLETPLETVMALAERTDRLVLNPAPARELPDDLLQRVYLITPNETETRLLTGVRVTDQQSATAAATLLRQKGVQHVIITMGAAGAYYQGPASSFITPAPCVKAVDTTAAGDVFNGALVVALSEGRSMRDAVAFAIRAASLSVTRMGAQTSAPYLTELR